MDFLFNNWLAILLFLLTIPLGVYINKRFYPKRKIAYTIQTFNTFNKPQVPDLDITYKGESIYNMYFSRILILNIGQSVISSREISENYPIKIQNIQRKAKILNYYLTYVSRPSNKFELNHDLTLKFDYLNPNDGCILIILFTVDSVDDNFTIINEENFKIDGELMGVDKIEKLSPYLLKDYSNVIFFTIFILSAIIVLPIVNWFFPGFWRDDNNFPFPLALFGVMLFGMIVVRPILFKILDEIVGKKRSEILRKFK